MKELVLGVVLLAWTFIILVMGHITHKFNPLIADPFKVIKFWRGNS